MRQRPAVQGQTSRRPAGIPAAATSEPSLASGAVDPQGKVAVVTGGASGIGRALALQLAVAGARGVVIGDLDGDGAGAMAQDIEGGRAVGVRCDAADPEQLDELLGMAEDAFGAPEIFCANAGIGTGAGLEASPETWDRALDVNLRAHVLAAQRVVPGWVQRGQGHFLVTASAAGLLTQIGDAPYAVTKHAAVAFAEWLAVTYGDRGVEVGCLCPMGVDTPLLRGARRAGSPARRSGGPARCCQPRRSPAPRSPGSGKGAS